MKYACNMDEHDMLCQIKGYTREFGVIPVSFSGAICQKVKAIQPLPLHMEIGGVAPMKQKIQHVHW